MRSLDNSLFSHRENEESGRKEYHFDTSVHGIRIFFAVLLGMEKE